MKINRAIPNLSALCIAISVCAAVDAATLSAVLISDKTPNSASIDYMFDGIAAKPTVYQTHNPPQLVVDFVADSVAPNFVSSEHALVQSVRGVHTGEITRSVIKTEAGVIPRVVGTPHGYQVQLKRGAASPAPINAAAAAAGAKSHSTLAPTVAPIQTPNSNASRSVTASSSSAGGIDTRMGATSQIDLQNGHAQLNDFATNRPAADARFSNRTVGSLAPSATYGQNSDAMLAAAPARPVMSNAPTISHRQAIAAPTPVIARSPAPSASTQYAHSIESVDFGGSDNIGEGVITVRLSSRDAVSDVEEINGKVVITVDDASVAQSLQRRLDVRDFGSPVMYIDTRQKGGSSKIEITPRTGLYDLSNIQTDRVLKVRMSARKNHKQAPKRFSGRQLSMNFQDIDVRAALQMIADFNDQNMVVSDSVDGNLTLRLRNVPWDEALDIVLRTKGLDSRSNGNVIYVAPSSELAALEAAEMDAKAKAGDSEPLITTYIPVNYAKAADVADLLDNEDADNNRGVLSGRGSVSFDTRTNTLLITETNERIAEIREVLRRIDVPVQQVMIEARIVVATDEFERELGVSMGGRKYGNTYSLPGSDASEAIPVSSGFNVNLGATARAGTFDLQLAKLPLGHLLDLELSAMQAEGRGEVISSPRVITTNQKVAIIEQGVEVPYLSRTEDDVAVEFRKATLSLEVTPQITPDERIIMDLNLKRDTVGPYYGEGQVQVPSIDTRNLQTQVLVRNGETVVLGGIYEKTTTRERDGLPGLSDLPVVGAAFRHTRDISRKNELLVFVTPKLLHQEL